MFVEKTQAQSAQGGIDGELVVEERNYRLVFDRTALSFSIEGANTRGTLASYSINPKRVMTATGLTGSDVKNWHEIQQQTFFKQQQKEEREL